ncbi:MAG: ketopantoate reductase family protein [Hyphomicrobiaceae bacterium]|nr:ketopantoate reductase family protein [Hyphomicrobiaceae bacterium]MCC0025019.1 ketopantoate reductase family protein [Hyphomicrobiaceae bacterium]
MRFIIYGVGAIGGALAVDLNRNGYEVVGIARGAQLEALRRDGLRLRTPEGDLHARFDTVPHPGDVEFRRDDVILLAMKSQHTEDALLALRDAGVRQQSIVCVQNGVANERMALRYFDHVLGAMLMMPVTFVTPGEVIASGTPKRGVLDIGTFPSGTDARADMICEALNASGYAAYAHEDVMRAKYGKLLLNLVNGIDAVLGKTDKPSKYIRMAREEALAVYEKAGIAYDDVGEDNPRRKALMQFGEVPGAPRIGSSAAQSLVRGAGSIEIDFLNGEIALLGRKYGVPTPVNIFFAELCQKFVHGGKQPGSLDEEGVDALFLAWVAEGF